MTAATVTFPKRAGAGWQIQRTGAIALAVAVFAIALGTRLWHLDLVTTTDEAYWMQRSVRFGAALGRGDWASTYRAGHPGVSVMWIGVLGIGPAGLTPFLSESFTRYELLQREPTYLEAFSHARRAVALVAAMLVTVAVLLCWRLCGAGPAIAAAPLLTLDPYVVGMTRLLHVDALLAPLMLVSALSGLVYWTVSARWPYLLLSAATGGLALLTKAPAGFVPVFLALVCLGGLLGEARGASPLAASARRMLRPLIAWGVLAAATYILLFPALWVNLGGRVQDLVGFVRAVGLQPHNGNFFLGRPVMDDPGVAYYLVALPLRLSPLVAVGVGLLVLKAAPSENRRAVRWLLVYAILFVGLMSLASKKFDRYVLPAQMALDVLAGVGWWRAARLTDEVFRGAGTARFARVAAALAVMLVVGQTFLLARVWPYPIAYYNPLAGGPERARELVMVGWGEGLEQVADYLTALPGSDELLVMTSYNNVLRPRFDGITLPIAPYVRGVAGLPSPDYVVLYVNAVQRQQTSPEIALAQAAGPPIFVARVNGMEYAWVYYLPRAGPRPSTIPSIEDAGEGAEN